MCCEGSGESNASLTAGTKRVRSYDLDGKLLWEFHGMSMISIPTPFAAHDLLYVASGYVADPFLRPVYAIRLGASGDILGPIPATRLPPTSPIPYPPYCGSGLTSIFQPKTLE